MKAKSIINVFLLFINLILFSSNIYSQCNRSTDSLALVALYNATDGANWTNTWDLNQSMDTWYGVTLTEEGCVEKLELDGDEAVSQCNNCAVPGNNLVGALPIEIWSMTSLKHLDLNNNSLTGEIPASIGNLTQLESLVLKGIYDDGLTGNIPTEIGNLSNLKYLNLGSNSFTGQIPASINNLQLLEVLILFINELNGSIPDMSALTSLRSFEIGGNDFSGPFPIFLPNLTELGSIRLDGCNFEGEIPDLSNLVNLYSLQLTQNNFEGNISNLLNALPNLSTLDISENQFTGDLNNFNVSLPNMRVLWLNNNQLTGTIPNFDAPELWWLRIENNQLLDFSELTNSPELFHLNIQNNKFSFEDILPNLGKTEFDSNFDYFPQAKFYKDTTIMKGIGSNLTIDLLIDDTVTSNVYKWYKDGQLITTINGNNEFTLNDIQESDEGIYYVEITNPNAPDLTLMSHNITIELLTDCYFDYPDLYNPIIPHIYNVQTTVESSGTVEANTSVTFIAGNSITLKEGFHAESGSDFLAKISDVAACDDLVEPSTPVVARKSSIGHNIELTVFPNPFQNQTTISYKLPETQQVHLVLYNLSGEQIMEISPSNTLEKGVYQYELFPHNIEAGFYIILLKTTEGIFSKKVVIIN